MTNKLFLASALVAMLATCFGAEYTLPIGAITQEFSVMLTFDESGTGRLTNTAGANVPLPFSRLADPGPGSLASVLFYGMLNPPGLVGGDVRILEPGTTALSDVLRFNPMLQGGGVFVYSDATEGADALADIGLPTGVNPNVFTLTEVGPEGVNGITYTPTAGQPGFVAGADGPVTYVFTSDTAIPEPSSLLIVLSGAAVLLCLRSARTSIFGPRR